MAGEKKDYNAQHRRNINAAIKRIEAIFEAAAQTAAAIGVSLPAFNPDKPFEFARYPVVSGRGKELINSLREAVTEELVAAATQEWGLANDKNDALSMRFLSGLDLPEEMQRPYFSTNSEALEAFLTRKDGGFSLSDRVWKYAEQFKTEIEDGIDIGLRDGLSAQQMATRLKSYLRNPDMLFRRVRDVHGVLRLSKRAAAYHPGRGVYRSSYQNARRLAATETNIAYRTADYLRWQEEDFVVGIRIQLSNNHNCKGVPAGAFYDICDELQGDYPKDFKFTGWHPLCRCIATPILKTVEEFADDIAARRNGETPLSHSKNEISELPDNFKNWVETNKERIERAEERGTLPYFIKDNEGRIGSILRLYDEYKILPTEKGKVRVHSKHGANELKENRIIAEYFANKYGQEIDLLPKHNNKPSPDAYNRTLGYNQEYKVNSSPTVSSIDRLIRVARKQADDIVIRINSSISVGDLRNAILGRVKRTNTIRSITIIKDGKDAKYMREQILSDAFKIKPEDFK